MSKKPKQEEPQEEQEVKTALTDEGDVTYFDYTDTTYCPVWNETFKRYDMLTIRLNKNTEECVVDKRESTRYDSPYRALHDLIERISSLFIKGE